MTKQIRNKKVEEIFTGTQVRMLIESFRDDVKLIAEVQSGMAEEIQGIKGEIQEMKEEIQETKDELAKTNRKLDSFIDETKGSFTLVFEHFSNFEDELTDIKKEIINPPIKSTPNFLKISSENRAKRGNI